MGRILEILRQDAGSGRAIEPPHTFSTDWAPSADKAKSTPHEDSEIPFIEVGPHKWMEASPGVMATTPLALTTPIPPAARDAGPVLAAAAEPIAISPTMASRRADSRRPEAPKKVFLKEFPGESALGHFASELVAFHAPDHAVSRQYREMVQAMVGRKEGPRALLFTAARGEAGTTTALLNLAISAINLGRSVVVVDANLPHPGVAERLGLPEAPGLREFLTKSATLEHILRRTQLKGLHAVAAGLRPTGTPPRITAERVYSLISSLRERVDLVFVDGPSWDGKPDVVALARECDAIYLVLPENEAESAEADSLCQLIPEQGGRLAGCILSRY